MERYLEAKWASLIEYRTNSIQFFGPAQQCMNAINFLADMVEAYNKIFVNLATLFDKIADTLERFELYRCGQNVLAEHIKNRANQILLRLITVCGLAYTT